MQNVIERVWHFLIQSLWYISINSHDGGSWNLSGKWIIWGALYKPNIKESDPVLLTCKSTLLSSWRCLLSVTQHKNYLRSVSWIQISGLSSEVLGHSIFFVIHKQGILIGGSVKQSIKILCCSCFMWKCLKAGVSRWGSALPR